MIFRLDIPNRVTSIRLVTAWISDSLKSAGFPKDLSFNLELCAEEAITNIISYGYQDDIEHQIVLQLDLGNNRVSLEIKDDGNPFNPLEMPVHVAPQGLADAKVGGLGVELVRKMMDECSYVRERNCNILKMTACLPEVRAGSA